LQRNTANNQTTHLLAMTAQYQALTLEQKMSVLEAHLSQIAGVPIEITIRDDRKFTYSFDGKNEAAYNRLLKYSKGSGTIGKYSGYDEDCDMTSVFHDA